MEKTYSVDELTDILGVGPIPIRGYIKTGKLKAFKVGRAYRIKESDLNDFMDRSVADTKEPSLAEKLKLRFTDPEHNDLFNEWVTEHGETDRERLALVYILTSDPITRSHFSDIYNVKIGEIKTDCLMRAWQTSESKQVCKLAFNLFNGWIDRNNIKSCSIPALMENDPSGVKRDALKLRFD